MRLACRVLRALARPVVAAVTPRGPGDDARAFEALVDVVRAVPTAALDPVVAWRLPFWSDLARAVVGLRRGDIFEYGVAVRDGGPVVVVHPSMHQGGEARAWN